MTTSLSVIASGWAPVFNFHGLTIDCIDKHQSNSEERRLAYYSDITYGTNNEFGFDYLRDNMAKRPEDLRRSANHHFAIVDEVDSVLIDDARTPLIISGPTPRGDEHEFYELKPRVENIAAIIPLKKGFSVWEKGFMEDKKTREDFCDESRTLVLRDVNDPNKVSVYLSWNPSTVNKNRGNLY